jgi:hypothetical protein
VTPEREWVPVTNASAIPGSASTDTRKLSKEKPPPAALHDRLNALDPR